MEPKEPKTFLGMKLVLNEYRLRFFQFAFIISTFSLIAMGHLKTDDTMWRTFGIALAGYLFSWCVLQVSSTMMRAHQTEQAHNQLANMIIQQAQNIQARAEMNRAGRRATKK